MVIVPDLKHNAFRPVSVPKASELVRAFGLSHPGTKYSGDQFLDPSSSKIDSASEVAKEASQYEDEHPDSE